MNTIKETIIILGACIFVSCGKGESKYATATTQNKYSVNRLSQESGIEFPSNTVITSYENTKGRETNFGFHAWTIISTNDIKVAEMGGSGTNHQLYEIPIEHAVALFEGQTGKFKVKRPLKTFSLQWHTNNFVFRATVLVTKDLNFVSLERHNDIKN